MPVDIHTKVHHDRYGKGEVIKVSSDKIYVVFGEIQRIFPYPKAFDKGFLTIDNREADKKEKAPDKLFTSLDSVNIKNSTREIILDAADNISYKKIYEAINATVGTNYSGWMKAGWPDGTSEYPFWLWFPKLAETKNGKLVSAAFDCINTISDDWNEVIYENLKDTPPEIDGSWRTSPTLIFAKEPKSGPYIFRGIYVRDTLKSRYKHHVVRRIGTRVKLIGQPAEDIIILDDFRN